MAEASAAGWAWLEGPRPSWPVRLGRAVLGWIPIALAIGWAGGELSGCARFTATCDGSTGAFVWLAQAGVLAILVALPGLAAPAAIAAIAAIGLAVPAALLLSAPGSEGASTGSAVALGILVGLAWSVGLGVGAWRAVRRAAEPLS
jgi:hypothetical protein